MYRSENTFRSGDFRNRMICVYLKKIWPIIPSILCYVPLSVELLGPTNPQFSNPDPRPPVFKPDWCLCSTVDWVCHPQWSMIIAFIVIFFLHVPLNYRGLHFLNWSKAVVHNVRPAMSHFVARDVQQVSDYFIYGTDIKPVVEHTPNFIAYEWC